MHLLQCLTALLVAAGHVYSATAATSNSSAPTVDLGYVKYRGLHNETLGVNYFYGIKFAAPPTGARRWRAAQPIEAHNNYSLSSGAVLDASRPGAQCMQQPLSTAGKEFIELLSRVPGVSQALGDFETPRNSSEDCLLLDVIVPAKPSAKSLLPVVIQIHGGGYTTGNSQTSDGGQFVSYSAGGIVWVQIQYRLNIYGFLGACDVLADGDPNIGLTDQRVAFDWVQRNIHRFGGDPARVTIWGGSAGGGSVMNHLIIEPEKPNPPFHAAIAEFPWWQPYHDQSILDIQYQQLLNASSCKDLECLRGLSQDKLFNATLGAYSLAVAQGSFGNGDDYYGPYVDGRLIRDLPSTEFEKGNFHHIPLLVDHDSFESVILAGGYGYNTTIQATKDLQQLWPAADQSFFDRLYQLYQLGSFTGSYFSQDFFSSQIYQILSSVIPTLKTSANDSVYWRYQTQFADYFIDCPTYYMASAMAGAGVNVWKLICNAGIYTHGAAGVYTLANSSVSGNATLADYMKDWFISFIYDLDPNTRPGIASNGSTSSPQRPNWPQYLGAGHNGTQFEVMQINNTNVGVIPDSDASARCDFFHAESYVVRN